MIIRTPQILKYPNSLNNLLLIQKHSFRKFLSLIGKKLKDFFPIKDREGKTVIKITKTKLVRTHTLIQLYILLETHIKTPYKESIHKKIEKAKILTLPKLHTNCSLKINNIERTIIANIRKAPGILFENTPHTSILKIIPHKGDWLQLRYNKTTKIITVKINKGKSINIFKLISALEIDINKMLKNFSVITKIKIINKQIYIKATTELKTKHITPIDIQDEYGEILIKKNTLITKKIKQQFKNSFVRINNNPQQLIVAKKFKIKNILFKKDKPLNLKKLNFINNNSLEIYIYNTTTNLINEILIKTLIDCKNIQSEVNKIEIMKTNKSTPKTTKEALIDKFNDKFLNHKNFILPKITRFTPSTNTPFHTLNSKTIILLIKKLIKKSINNQPSNNKDNINKKITVSIGEQLMEVIEKKLNIFGKILLNKQLTKNYQRNYTPEFFTPFIKEFLCTSQFSQFLDQNNDLSEITHKRRINLIYTTTKQNLRNSKIREIDTSFYGKICPIETPEGPNIGLINSFALLARINDKNKIVTPVYKIKNHKIIQRPYFTSLKHTPANIATAPELIQAQYISIKSNNKLLINTHKRHANYCLLTTAQLFSIAPLLIPFLENNDANRALMGSNMQRQALNCIKKTIPIVQTGYEHLPTRSLNNKHYKTHHNIQYIDSKHLITQLTVKNRILFRIIKIKKFTKTNQGGTTFERYINPESTNYKTHLLKDSTSTQYEKLALGQNILAAFIPWYGYNFEDAIIISKQLARSDKFCSLHTEEHTVEIKKDKKISIKKHIFTLTPQQSNKLDKLGIIKVGQTICTGDILVTKVKKITPQKISAENKLLNTIFNRKEKKYKKKFFIVPENTKGIVTEVTRTYENDKCISREALKEKLKILTKLKKLITATSIHTNKTKHIPNANWIQSSSLSNKLIKIITSNRLSKINAKIAQLKKNLKLFNSDLTIKEIKITIIRKKYLKVGDKMSGRHGNKGVIAKILPIEDMPFLKDGTPCDMILNPLGIPSRMNIGQILEITTGLIAFLFKRSHKQHKKSLLHQLTRLKDIKIQNTHPYKNLQVITRPFEGLKHTTITRILKLITNPKLKKKYDIKTDKIAMFDGITGQRFKKRVLCGYIYFLKLNHLASEKIHARSIGNYSAVTQQPLKGKAQFGGQRLGEMEVWALEAYGAAYTLQEMITIKSDDIKGRKNIYKTIYFKDHKYKFGKPESFNILIQELKALMINIQVK
ncbi:DNA-directed RNA polymerase subunit beta [Candidatus Vidania fulgoroideorum]